MKQNIRIPSRRGIHTAPSKTNSSTNLATSLANPKLKM